MPDIGDLLRLQMSYTTFCDNTYAFNFVTFYFDILKETPEVIGLWNLRNLQLFFDPL